MIPLSLGEVVAAYVIALVAILLLLAMLGGWLRARRERRHRRRQVQCCLCGEPYEPADGIELPPCPACGHLNERRPRAFF